MLLLHEAITKVSHVLLLHEVIIIYSIYLWRVMKSSQERWNTEKAMSEFHFCHMFHNYILYTFSETLERLIKQPWDAFFFSFKRWIRFFSGNIILSAQILLVIFCQILKRKFVYNKNHKNLIKLYYLLEIFQKNIIHRMFLYTLE